MEVKATESLRLTWSQCVISGNEWSVGLELYNEAGVLATQFQLPFLSDGVTNVPVQFSCDPPDVAEVLQSNVDIAIPLSTAKASFKLRILPTNNAATASAFFRLRATPMLAASTLRIMPVLSQQMLLPLAPCEADVLSAISLSSYREVCCTVDAGALERTKIVVLEQPNVVGFFGVLWDSALVLSNFLLDDTSLVQRSRNVVELGAATGLCSMVVKRANPLAHVVATDLEHMIQLGKENFQENKFPAQGLTAVAYQWGDKEIDSRRMLGCDHHQTMGADILTDNPAGNVSQSSSACPHTSLCRHTFDLIIASDVIFDPAYWDDLWQSFDDLLMTNDGLASSISANESGVHVSDHCMSERVTPQVVLVNRNRHPLEADFFTHPASSKWRRVRVDRRLKDRIEVGTRIKFEDTTIDIIARKE